MASGTVSQAEPRSINLPAGEVATITGITNSSYGTVYVYASQDTSQLVAQGTVAPRGTQTFGPYGAAVRLQVVPASGALSFSTTTPAARNYKAASPITPGTPVAPGDGVAIACSAAGMLRLVMVDGSFLDFYATQGTAIVDNLAVTGVSAAGTTATCSVSVLRRY